MPIKNMEVYEFGGVDSRSNPLNLPKDRCLRCRNWIPKAGGWLELRRGYKLLGTGSANGQAIHSRSSYRQWNGSQFILVGAGTQVSVFNVGSGVTTGLLPLLSSNSKWNTFASQNRQYLGNGVDMYFWDGAKLRAMGIRAPNAAETAGFTSTWAGRALTGPEQAAVTVTGSGAGGTFPATTANGYQFFLMQINTNDDQDAGIVVTVGGLITLTGTTSSIAIGSIPNKSPGYKWVVCRGAGEGASQPPVYVLATGTLKNLSGAPARTGVNVVYQCTAHGFSVGDVVTVNSGDPNFSRTGVLTAITTNTFTILDGGPNVTASSSTGTAAKVLAVDGATGGTLTVTNNGTSSIASPAGGNRGVPASVVGGPQPGYDFYMCYYNPITQACSNRAKLTASRLAPVSAQNANFSGIPDMHLLDPNGEWVKVLGRTVDGGEIPYLLTDVAGNVITIPAAQTTYLLRDYLVDYNRELPVFNDVPVGMDKFARVGDYIIGNPPNSPTIYRSASEALLRAGVFLGDPAESWSAKDIDTFPTGEAISCVAEWDYEAWCFSLNDLAVFGAVGDVWGWRGPYNVGCAGQRAFVKTPYGPYWLTANKELATLSTDGPTVISEEYEKGLLRNIGDQYIGATELAYIRDVNNELDHVKIKARDANGNPFVIIHDFKLRSPHQAFTVARAAYGQAYDAYYSDTLGANDWSLLQARDANGVQRNFALSSDSKVYQLDTGSDDNGATFTADYISLFNFGLNRLALKYVEWNGDGNVVVSIAQLLNALLQDILPLDTPGNAQKVQGGENDFQFRSYLKSTEVKNAFVRFQLTSQTPGGNNPPVGTDLMGLNDPVHMPLEAYGRIYRAVPGFDDERGHSD